MDWEEAFHSEKAKALFSPLVKWEGGKQIFHVSAQDIIDRVTSVSVVALASEEKKKQVAEDIFALLEAHKSNISLNSEGKYPLEYITNIAHADKL